MIGCMHHLIFGICDSVKIELCHLVWAVFVNGNSLCAFHFPEYFVSVLYLCISLHSWHFNLFAVIIYPHTTGHEILGITVLRWRKIKKYLYSYWYRRFLD